MSSVFVIVAMFRVLRDRQRFVEAIPELLPFDRARSEALPGRIEDVVQASVYGVVVIARLQEALCEAMFWVVGVPAAAKGLRPLTGTSSATACEPDQ